ncbi:MAG: extracellular solute-binding protein [Treponema sp.]|nr:extracellular solute-binding protein [Treponema sp.]
MKRAVLLIGILLLVGSTLVFASGTKQSAPAAANSGVIVLNYAHWDVGTALSKPWWDAVYKRFNDKYKGKIELNLEELPTDTMYAEKMKVLAATKQLPDVIDGKDGVRDLAIKNGQAIELTPYLNRDPDFRDKAIGPDAIAANTGSDGKVYSIINTTGIVGYFYNKDLFRKAGITPAKTWDEWFSNCDKLKAIGVAPIAMMTGENSWTTNLILAAMVASRGPAGQTFMNTKYPQTYQIPEMIQGLGDIQRCLQNYATADSLGAAYANAANNFLMEQAAIIANGPWMIADFSNPDKTAPGFDKKVGWSMYPGDGLIATYWEGYVLCSPPERADAGWILLQALTDRDSQLDALRTMGALPVAVDLQIPDDVRQNMPMVVEHVDALAKMKYHASTFDVEAPASVVDAFGRYYPQLATGAMTPSAMAAQLDQAAAGAR